MLIFSPSLLVFFFLRGSPRLATRIEPLARCHAVGKRLSAGRRAANDGLMAAITAWPELSHVAVVVAVVDVFWCKKSSAARDVHILSATRTSCHQRTVQLHVRSR